MMNMVSYLRAVLGTPTLVRSPHLLAFLGASTTADGKLCRRLRGATGPPRRRPAPRNSRAWSPTPTLVAPASTGVAQTRTRRRPRPRLRLPPAVEDSSKSPVKPGVPLSPSATRALVSPKGTLSPTGARRPGRHGSNSADGLRAGLPSPLAASPYAMTPKMKPKKDRRRRRTSRSRSRSHSRGPQRSVLTRRRRVTDAAVAPQGSALTPRRPLLPSPKERRFRAGSRLSQRSTSRCSATEDMPPRATSRASTQSNDSDLPPRASSRVSQVSPDAETPPRSSSRASTVSTGGDTPSPHVATVGRRPRALSEPLTGADDAAGVDANPVAADVKPHVDDEAPMMYRVRGVPTLLPTEEEEEVYTTDEEDGEGEGHGGDVDSNPAPPLPAPNADTNPAPFEHLLVSTVNETEAAAQPGMRTFLKIGLVPFQADVRLSAVPSTEEIQEELTPVGGKLDDDASEDSNPEDGIGEEVEERLMSANSSSMTSLSTVGGRSLGRRPSSNGSIVHSGTPRMMGTASSVSLASPSAGLGSPPPRSPVAPPHMLKFAKDDETRPADAPTEAPADALPAGVLKWLRRTGRTEESLAVVLKRQQPIAVVRNPKAH